MLRLPTCGVDGRPRLAPQCAAVAVAAAGGDGGDGGKGVMTSMRRAIMRSGVLALLGLAAAGIAAASPLRVSLHGLDDPGPVTSVPGRTAPARFVAAADMPSDPPAPAERQPAADEDTGQAFVPTHELPLGEAGPDLALPPPDDSVGVARLLDGAGAVAVAPPASDRRLGEFVPPPPATVADAIDGPPADAEPLPELPVVDLDALRQQRLAVMMVVVPLVLAATVVWWRVERGRRHHRRSRRSHARSMRPRHG